jgi:hypothetical protein
MAGSKAAFAVVHDRPEIFLVPANEQVASKRVV